jgi:hypothetical protein
LVDINRTLSQIQFSRPSSAGPIPSSSRNMNSTMKTQTHNFNRPQSASYMMRFDTTGSGALPISSDPFPPEDPDDYRLHSTQTKSMTSFPPQHTNNTQHLSQSLKSFSKQKELIPHYVATDKQVLRFYCHFYDNNIQLTYQPIRNFQSPSTIRYITLHYFLCDETFEMFSNKTPNSGIQGGPFYRRDVLKKSPVGGKGGIKGGDELVRIEELSVGGTFSALGRDFFITDCDEFTREYFRYLLILPLLAHPSILPPPPP